MADSPMLANLASAKILGDDNHILKTGAQSSRMSPNQSTSNYLTPNNFLKDPTYGFEEDI
jgi:hypothetical protein